jgi:hypothetical protein
MRVGHTSFEKIRVARVHLVKTKLTPISPRQKEKIEGSQKVFFTVSIYP